jgi:outer membrane protein assembly factor BamB
LAAPATNVENNISSSAWDGTTLYAAAALTSINGKSCDGSLRALNPADGTFLWEDCLNHVVLAPVTAVPGLAVVDAGGSLIIVDAARGDQLFNFQDKNARSSFAGPASISNGVLYQGDMNGNLYALGP